MLGERWIRALHVEAMRDEEVHAAHEHHVLFQASTTPRCWRGSTTVR
jgi:hypothetical protein